MMMCHPLGALFTALGTMLAPLAYAALVYPDTPSGAVFVLLTVLGGLASGGLWLVTTALLWRREPAPEPDGHAQRDPGERAGGDRR